MDPRRRALQPLGPSSTAHHGLQGPGPIATSLSANTDNARPLPAGLDMVNSTKNTAAVGAVSSSLPKQATTQVMGPPTIIPNRDPRRRPGVLQPSVVPYQARDAQRNEQDEGDVSTEEDEPSPKHDEKQVLQPAVYNNDSEEEEDVPITSFGALRKNFSPAMRKSMKGHSEDNPLATQGPSEGLLITTGLSQPGGPGRELHSLEEEVTSPAETQTPTQRVKQRGRRAKEILSANLSSDEPEVGEDDMLPVWEFMGVDENGNHVFQVSHILEPPEPYTGEGKVYETPCPRSTPPKQRENMSFVNDRSAEEGPRERSITQLHNATSYGRAQPRTPSPPPVSRFQHPPVTEPLPRVRERRNATDGALHRNLAVGWGYRPNTVTSDNVSRPARALTRQYAQDNVIPPIFRKNRTSSNQNTAATGKTSITWLSKRDFTEGRVSTVVNENRGAGSKDSATPQASHQQQRQSFEVVYSSEDIFRPTDTAQEPEPSASRPHHIWDSTAKSQSTREVQLSSVRTLPQTSWIHKQKGKRTGGRPNCPRDDTKIRNDPPKEQNVLQSVRHAADEGNKVDFLAMTELLERLLDNERHLLEELGNARADLYEALKECVLLESAIKVESAACEEMAEKFASSYGSEEEEKEEILGLMWCNAGMLFGTKADTYDIVNDGNMDGSL